ncbi:MAG: DUF1028 domain-containing protein [Halovenus sp.]
MTFSICVREAYEDDEGTSQIRYGVAVTTRLAGVGTLCPFASANGAAATQSFVNVELGRRTIDYLDDGLAVEDAMQALLNADDGSEQRQLHGVGENGEFAFSGVECKDWYGHTVGDNFTVAGNLLTGKAVIDETASTYRESRGEDRPLAKRLVDALAAGHAEGGDKREELHVQSAAVVVERTEDRPITPAYDNLRVDATETPIEDMRETLELATESYEMALERYEEDYEEDDESGM